MKRNLHIFTLVFILALTGCVTSRPTSGVPHPSETQVRQRLAEVAVLRDAEARVREVRFSKDGEVILVLLDLPAGSKAVPELYLRDDGFNRYKGEFFAENTQAARRPFIIDFGKR
jgi:hypothetical protein